MQLPKEEGKGIPDRGRKNGGHEPAFLEARRQVRGEGRR